ncbi:calcium-binding protein [Tritrichomonas foetus]|uniref:Calcium-binding protein n=1 Tax=Tritrichomonas foetus TaxID=1144522 RepID=A0A1J4JJ04_9EUKA|nr:calcium-binding protein [Tritrichomonas foetus]|eukprot:OHS99130.1 calcium-binding protein [Tritrichomonas foetus]
MEHPLPYTIDGHLFKLFNDAKENADHDYIKLEKFAEILKENGYDIGPEYGPNRVAYPQFKQILSDLKYKNVEIFKFDDFKLIMKTKFNYMSTRMQVEKAFSVFCHSNEGRLFKDDLNNILRLANPDLTQAQIDNLLRDLTPEEKTKGVLYPEFVGRLLDGKGDPVSKDKKQSSE